MLIAVYLTLFAVNSFGQSITWQRVLENNYGSINKIQQTTDGGYIAVGDERINNENKIYLVKLDYLGNTTWERIIGLGENQGNWVEQTTDGGFIIGGSTTGMGALGTSDAYLIKTDSGGAIEWQRLFSNIDIEQCYCVKQTQDEGYILSCRTVVTNEHVMYIKTDSKGIIQWRKVYQFSLDMSPGEISTVSNGYVTTGEISNVNSNDAYILRLDSVGDTLWLKRFGGNNSEFVYSIDRIGNEGYIIGGSSRSFSTNNKIESYLCRVDTIGNIIWQKTYSDIGRETGHSIRYKPNIGFVFAGTSDSLNNNILKAKIRFLDLNGNLLYTNSYLSNSIFWSVELTNDNGYIAGGLHSSFSQMYVVKTDSFLHSTPIGISSINNSIPREFKLYQNYPNPFNPVTNIKFSIPQAGQKPEVDVQLKIYDITGREVYTYSDTKQPGTYEIQFDGTNLASGMYFYTLIAGDSNNPLFKETKKMVLLK